MVRRFKHLACHKMISPGNPLAFEGSAGILFFDHETPA
jgi:hypothetical protein